MRTTLHPGPGTGPLTTTTTYMQTRVQSTSGSTDLDLLCFALQAALLVHNSVYFPTSTTYPASTLWIPASGIHPTSTTAHTYMQTIRFPGCVHHTCTKVKSGGVRHPIKSGFYMPTFNICIISTYLSPNFVNCYNVECCSKSSILVSSTLCHCPWSVMEDEAGVWRNLACLPLSLDSCWQVLLETPTRARDLASGCLGRP